MNDVAMIEKLKLLKLMMKNEIEENDSFYPLNWSICPDFLPSLVLGKILIFSDLLLLFLLLSYTSFSQFLFSFGLYLTTFGDEVVVDSTPTIS